MNNNSQEIRDILVALLSKYTKQFAVLFIILLLEGIVAGLSVLALIPLASYLIDPQLNNPGRIVATVKDLLAVFGWDPSFWTFSLIFVGLNGLKGLCDIGIRYSVLKIKYTVVRGLFKEALQTFFQARWEFFSGTEQGKLLSTLNKELNTIGDTLGHMASMLAQILQLCIYMAIPLWLNPSLTLMTFVMTMILGLPFLLFKKVSYNLGKQNTETGNRAMGTLTELLAAARLIIGYGRQAEARDRYLAVFDKHVGVTLRSQTLAVTIPNLYKPLGMLAAIVSMGVALHNGAPISELGAVMWSLLASLPILVSLFHGSISIQNFIPSYQQLMQLQNQASAVREIEGGRLFEKLHSSIQLSGLTFCYPGRCRTLTQIDLVIEKGRMTALVGESGSGKSTITDLILGLQIPQAGAVLIDGIPLNEWKQNSFRLKVGYVPQEPLLFHASIRENLLWSYPHASEEDLWNALRQANAESFVKQLPDGIDTVVGDRGSRLSGGQRQRIALARAMLRKPELLILDEATSALDSESERLIQQSINELAQDTTILVIAHRLSTIAKADRIYVLQEGRVYEEGAFEELLSRKNGLFFKMVLAQEPVETRLYGLS